MSGIDKPIVELSGIKLRMGRHIVPEVRKHFEDGTYEWPELNALQEKLTPDDVVMELGAGIGLVSACCARAIGSDRVFAYEANPLMEWHIRDTYALNGVSPNLEMCLLGETDGLRTFYVHDAFWESSSIADGRTAKAITVPCRGFNDELARVNPTFLVIDIEGGELEICRNTRFHEVRKVLIELHEKLGIKGLHAVRSALYRAGFRVNRSLCNWDVLYLERT